MTVNFSQIMQCFFCHEHEVGRGAIEICSCVLKYLEGKTNTNNNDRFKIVLYSDSSYDRQKNNFTMGMYMNAVRKLR